LPRIPLRCIRATVGAVGRWVEWVPDFAALHPGYVILV